MFADRKFVIPSDDAGSRSDRARQSRDLAFISVSARWLPCHTSQLRDSSNQGAVAQSAGSFFPAPALQLFFAINGVPDILKTLPVYETGGIVIVRETISGMVLV